MKTTTHPRELSDDEAEAIVDEFTAADDYVVTGTIRQRGRELCSALLGPRSVTLR